jgi:hypothetical protein
MTLIIRASRSHRARLTRDYTRRLLNAAPIALWPLDEPAGPVALCLPNRDLDATYSLSGIAYAADSDGPFKTAAPTFDGNDTHAAFGSPAFAAKWDGDLFSMISWGRVDGAARWTDATTYRYLMHVRSSADVTYYAVMGKSQTDHQLEWRRRTGGAIVSQTYTFNPTGPLDWFCMGMTHDQTVPVLNFYLWDSINGFQTLTPSNSASLTAWGANPPDHPGSTLAMAGSSTLQEWIGAGALHALWDRMLTPAQMQVLMTP